LHSGMGGLTNRKSAERDGVKSAASGVVPVVSDHQ